MLFGGPDRAYSVAEPGVNTLRCPTHNHWLYRRKNIESVAGPFWCCGVQGCDYGYDVATKAGLLRTR